MKAQKIISLFMLATLVQGSAMYGQTAIQADSIAITNMSKARAAAFNQGNAEEIAKHFTADAVLMAPGTPASIGKEAVWAYYQGIFDAYHVQLDSYYEEVEVSGNMAYGRGEATVRLRPRKGGKSFVTASKYLNILQRQPDGSWKTTHDIWNDNGKLH